MGVREKGERKNLLGDEEKSQTLRIISKAHLQELIAPSFLNASDLKPKSLLVLQQNPYPTRPISNVTSSRKLFVTPPIASYSPYVPPDTLS